MSREIIGGNDPIGINPPAIVQQVRENRTQKAIEAYRQGILLPDVTVARADQAAVVKGVVGDDGKALTLEERQKIAAQRKPYDPLAAVLKPEDFAYDEDLKDRKVEPIGESAQKVIDANPTLRLAPVRNDLEITTSSEIKIVTPNQTPEQK